MHRDFPEIGCGFHKFFWDFNTFLKGRNRIRILLSSQRADANYRIAPTFSFFGKKSSEYGIAFRIVVRGVILNNGFLYRFMFSTTDKYRRNEDGEQNDVSHVG